MATTPPTTSYQRQRVAEGGGLFFVPDCRANDLRLVFNQSVGQQRHQREQSEQDWRRARYRQVIPLPLCFDAQMRPRFCKGHFHPPTPHKPSQNLKRRVRQFGREKGTRFEFSAHITHQHPANRHIRFAGSAPQTNLAVNLDFAFAAAILVFHFQFFPFGFAILQPLFGRKTPRAFAARSPLLTRFARRREVIQLRVHSQPRNHTDVFATTDLIQQDKHRKAAVGDKHQRASSAIICHARSVNF